MQESTFQRAHSIVSSESRAPNDREYIPQSTFIQPSPSDPAHSLPWAATATVTAQPPAAAENVGIKNADSKLPKSRLSPYFSHRSVNGSSSLLGRPRASSISSTSGGSSNDNLAHVLVRRNVFSSMSENLAFSGTNKTKTKESSQEEQNHHSSTLVPTPVTLRRISVQWNDPASSTSPSTTELALGLSNLTLTDEFEVKARYRGASVSDGGSSANSTGNGITAPAVPAAAAALESIEKKAANSSTGTVLATTTAITSETAPTITDYRNSKTVPMLSPDGKLVGYRQNSSMMRRQMQMSMPFSDSATPPESPLYNMNSNSNSNTSGSTPRYTAASDTDDFLAASQDPWAGFPDAENQLHGYLLGPVVGRGGFSSVHKGLHVATSLPLAVKVIDKSRMRDPKDRDRVDREMRAMRQLSGHIGIAQLLECAETPQYLYIIMEYCAGGSLLDYVREKRRLSENEASMLFQQLLAALEHCHWRGVVHRDIKLENVLLDGHGGVKLIDFGLCGYYVHDKPLRCHCGSPSYAAPEIVARKDYMAGPVDVWSAGVVLYAMLAGYLPFQAKDKKSLSTKIIKATWTPPSCASAAAVDLLERMLTLNPEERICLNEIWAHPWVVNGPRWEGNGEGPNGLMRTTVDGEVADAWVHISNTEYTGITMSTLLRALRLKECNATTAGYHLLCQAKISKNEINSNEQYKMEISNNNSSCDDDEATGVAAATSSDLDIFI